MGKIRLVPRVCRLFLPVPLLQVRRGVESSSLVYFVAVVERTNRICPRKATVVSSGRIYGKSVWL